MEEESELDRKLLLFNRQLERAQREQDRRRRFAESRGKRGVKLFHPRKGTEIEAYRLEEDKDVHTRRGILRGLAGEWVVEICGDRRSWQEGDPPRNPGDWTRHDGPNEVFIVSDGMLRQMFKWKYEGPPHACGEGWPNPCRVTGCPGHGKVDMTLCPGEDDF